MAQRQRQSAVLILALLLMGTITASTIALSTVIADSTHQTRTLNDFIAASLAADSGVERGLAVVKAGRSAQNITDTISAVTPPVGSGLPDGLTVSASNSGSGDKFTWQTLQPNQSVSFDILSYDASGNLTTPGTDSIHIAGTPNTVNSTPGQGALDISWVGLNANGVPFYSGRYFMPTTEVTSGITIDLKSLRDVSSSSQSNIDLGLLHGFRVRITAIDRPDNAAFDGTQNTLFDTVSNILVTGNGTTGGFPSRINITSDGVVNQSQSEKTASVLWQLPASGVFNYVLFTEGSIIPQ